MAAWSDVIDIAPRVAEALARHQPVVALESAVISHGLPHPTGIETAGLLEDVVRAGGAVPATIGVIDGRIKVGLAAAEMARLARSAVMKVASRDLPVAMVTSASGGTTVSATVMIAEAVGIRVVSTGGIGGVHLGAEETWDVSADLVTLSRHPVAVVCSGAKAICDAGRTLEYLDTAGVTVVVYRASTFPHFYILDSGCVAPQIIDSPDEAARILAAKDVLGQHTGLLIANPIPAKDALAPGQTRNAVQAAVERARAAGVRGGDLTPYLLAALAEITGGESLRANLALLRSNAALAAAVAKAVWAAAAAR